MLTLPAELAGDDGACSRAVDAPSTLGGIAPPESPRLLPRPALREGREPSFSSAPKRFTRVAHNIDGELVVQVQDEPAGAMPVVPPPPVVPSLPRMVPRPAAGRTSIHEPAFDTDSDLASARKTNEPGVADADAEPPPTIRTWLKGNWSGVVPRHEY